MTPVLLTETDDLSAVLRLMRQSFAYLDGVIDPPTSLHRMAEADLRKAAQVGELWVIPPGPAACVILTPQMNTLYLGKLAVTEAQRGKGLSRILVDHAIERARALDLPRVTLQTRVELTANHRAFRAMGFVEAGRTAHPGYSEPTSITFVCAV